jgi:hypothetical protein
LTGIAIEFNWTIHLVTIKLVLTTIKLKTFLGALSKLTLVKDYDESHDAMG